MKFKLDFKVFKYILKRIQIFDDFYQEGNLYVTLVGHNGGVEYTFDSAGSYVRLGNLMHVTFSAKNINTVFENDLSRFNTRTNLRFGILNQDGTREQINLQGGQHNLNIGYMKGLLNQDFYSVILGHPEGTSFTFQRDLDGSMEVASEALEFQNGELHVHGTLITNLYTVQE
ncbi:hypothetical protein [uncultured Tenacibaculum sp.]|uniref:hypothetical protein n=1 Tax=uncultured Tenacibaculum sp. TaxID=174713 RepID=UPI002611B8ED|nr:hypothetical protein [uncultured Tenacibaculum sp.]